MTHHDDPTTAFRLLRDAQRDRALYRRSPERYLAQVRAAWERWERAARLHSIRRATGRAA